MLIGANLTAVPKYTAAIIAAQHLALILVLI